MSIIVLEIHQNDAFLLVKTGFYFFLYKVIDNLELIVYGFFVFSGKAPRENESHVKMDLK
jgi:hypothetical protein